MLYLAALGEWEPWATEGHGRDSGGGMTREEALRNTHAWFEVNSGWAPPDEETLTEWVSDGVCRCPDECVVAPEGWCEHGLASWWLVLGAIDEPPWGRRRPAGR